MKKAFMCSLCHRGVLGGGLYLDAQSLTFVCQKLTVEPKYKRLVLPLGEIDRVEWKRVVFPVATFHMTGGEHHTFLLFHKRRFEKWFRHYRHGEGETSQAVR